jgi:hypothetical protein
MIDSKEILIVEKKILTLTTEYAMAACKGEKELVESIFYQIDKTIKELKLEVALEVTRNLNKGDYDGFKI